jgi:hypothetical protein
MKIPLIAFDIPNKNRRVYPKEAFEKFEGKEFPIYIKQPDIQQGMDIRDIIGKGTVIIEGDMAYVEAELIDKDAIDLVNQSVAVGGTGIIENIDGVSVVKEYTLDGFFMTDKPSLILSKDAK